MRNLFLWEIFQVFFPLPLLFRLTGPLFCGFDNLFHDRFRGGFIVIRFSLIKKGELPRDIIQFFCLATKTLLVCKPDLFYEGFIVLFQLVEPVLHLEDNIVFCCMVHLIQFIRSEFFTHDVRLSF